MKLPKLFGRRKANVSPWTIPAANEGAWVSLHSGENRAGDWQRGISASRDDLLDLPVVFSCVTLIAGDISKLGMGLKEKTAGVWRSVDGRDVSRLLRQPNRFQGGKRFMETWMLSKLTWGNAYIYKVRDDGGKIVALYVLDPSKVKPLVAPGAAVFYQVGGDNLSPISGARILPASEIIHDVMNPLYHPLVGISPLRAATLSAMQGAEIQRSAEKFFRNGAVPSGILVAPGDISAEVAERLQRKWEEKYKNEQYGRTAVLSNGMEYKQTTIPAVDAQLVEQLKFTAESICTAFHVPPFKVGVSPLPGRQDAAALNQIYYSDCLQKPMEDAEEALTLGLELPERQCVELNVENLLRMDLAAQAEWISVAVGGAFLTVDEGRGRFNAPATPGGDVVYRQQQDHSLEALAKRDAMLPAPGAIDDPGDGDETVEKALSITREVFS